MTANNESMKRSTALTILTITWILAMISLAYAGKVVGYNKAIEEIERATYGENI